MSGFGDFMIDEVMKLNERLKAAEIALEQSQKECERLLVKMRELERELGEAWKEMLCCDDIKLDQPLADAICDLQKAREKAEGDVVKATAAFDKYWAETCKERARADAAEASLAQVQKPINLPKSQRTER